MSFGKFQFLGENIDFRILVDQIFANNEISCCTVQVSFRMQFSLFGRNDTYSFTKATINSIKAELRTKDSHIKCEVNTGRILSWPTKMVNQKLVYTF